ncbi:MAG: acetyltransferase [Bacteroidota bacterium]
MIDNKVPVLIVGTESPAYNALEIAQSLDVLVLGFLTTKEEEVNKEINDILIVAALESDDANTLLQDESSKVVIAEEDMSLRQERIEQIDGKGAEIVNLFHETCTISSFSKLGRGILMNAGSYIQPNVLLGSFNLIGSQVSIGTGSVIGDYCTIQDGVKIGKEVAIEDEVFIGIGAVIHPKVALGKGAMIAAGSVVMQDVQPGTSVFGNPAKEV